MSDYYSIGSTRWPGLSKMIEETGELQQVAGKLLGSDGEIRHWDGTNLRERLHEEIADVQAALIFFQQVNALDITRIDFRTDTKLAQFWKWHRGEE